MSNNAPPAPPPAPMPSGQNPYDFILNPGQKQRRGLGDRSFTQRIIIVAIGAGLLLIALVLGLVLLSSSGKSGTQSLVSLAQQQNEIARVAAIGVDKASSSDTQNLAITAELSLESSQQELLSVLSKSGHKVSSKTLALSQNSQTDNQLNAASSSGNFDDTFTQILQSELTSYRTLLQTDYKTAIKASEKQALLDSFNTASTLASIQAK